MTTIYVDYDVPSAAFTRIESLALNRFERNLNWNGATILVRRGEYTYIDAAHRKRRKMNESEYSQELINAVVDHARPMTGGQSWQWSQIVELVREEVSEDVDAPQRVADEIREANGFTPLPTE
jgi:hypothetical protein